jgi:hypothetical protein
MKPRARSQADGADTEQRSCHPEPNQTDGFREWEVVDAGNAVPHHACEPDPLVSVGDCDIAHVEWLPSIASPFD